MVIAKRFKYFVVCVCVMNEEIMDDNFRCEKCKSKQVRTTKYFRICIRCGHKEELK